LENDASGGALTAIGSYDCLHGESTRNPRIDELLEVFDFWFGERDDGVDEERVFGEGCGEGESVRHGNRKRE